MERPFGLGGMRTGRRNGGLERLGKEAASWEEAQRLRAYAEAALEKLKSSRDESEEVRARRVELKWLLGYVDRIDPLSG